MKLLENLMTNYMVLVNTLLMLLAIFAVLSTDRRYRWLSLLAASALVGTAVLEVHTVCIVLWSVLLVLDLYLCALFYNVVRFIPAGSMLPRFYGIAYAVASIERNGAICAPIPLNVAVAICYFGWNWAKSGGRSVPMSLHAAYEQGRQDERKNAGNVAAVATAQK